MICSVVFCVGAVVPDSNRPRFEFAARYALVATKFAASPDGCTPPAPLPFVFVTPGTLRTVTASCTSAFGMVYTTSALKFVSHGSTRWQNSRANCGPAAAVPPALAGPFVSISGTCAMTAQLSATVCPVLVPAWNRNPFCSRPPTLTSTPFQCSYSSPYLSDNVLYSWLAIPVGVTFVGPML